MSIALDDHHLPTIVQWLVDLNGEVQVRGILGDDFEAIRSGRLGLYAMAPDLEETLCKMVEGAIAAGMKPPLPPEPDQSPPEVARAPAEGGGQNVRRTPGHSEGRDAAPPPVMKSPPRADTSAQTPSERPRTIRDNVGSRREDREVLLLLLGHLLEAEEIRNRTHPLHKWVTLAKNKAALCLMADHNFRFREDHPRLMPRKEEMALYSRWIKRSEKEMEMLSRRSPLLRLFLDRGYLAPEEILKRVAHHQNLKISDQLMLAILRQGRD